MKNILALTFLVASSVSDGATCDLLSGSFKTMTECYVIHNGVRSSDGHRELRISYDENTKNFRVDFVSSNYWVNYVADGKEQGGRPQFEGDKYTAICKDNHAHIRAEFSALKKPLIHSYAVIDEGKLSFKEAFEADTSFIRVCEMERF